MRFLRNIVGHLLNKPVSAALTLGIPLVVVAWHALAQPRHLHEIARELGSIRQLREIPTPNHAGTKVVLARTMEETDIGVYLCDLGSGERILIHKYPPTGKFTFLGWSNDDEYFALHTGFFLRIYKSSTAELMAQIPFRNLEGGGWMSNEALFVSTKDRSIHQVGVGGSQWGKEKPFYAFRGGHTLPGARSNFVALGGDEVAWRDGNSFWAIGTESEAPRLLCEAPADIKVLDVNYVQGMGRFLLLCSDAKGKFLASLDIGNSSFQRLKTPPGIEPILFSWMGSKGGYIFSGVNAEGLVQLTVKPAGDDAPSSTTNWFVLWTIACNDFGAFIVGAQGAEPTALWTYEAKSGAMNSVVSSCDVPLKYARIVEPELLEITNAAGTVTHLSVFSPTRFAYRNKYPVVICEGPRNYEQIIANSGAFCVSVTSHDGGWPTAQDFLAAYKHLAGNPNVDRKRVYIMSSSKGTLPLAILLKWAPQLWQGAILFSPAWLPSPLSHMSMSKVFIDIGEKDLTRDNGRGHKFLSDWQREAVGSPVLADVRIQKGEGHVYSAGSSQIDRISKLMQFLNRL